MNILVVDDVASDRKLLRARLVAEGMTVFEASDGVEALAVLDQEKIEAVISDILMPRMDGYRLCHHVRQRERLKGLPFIFLSANYASPSDERFAFELGADKFVKKPCSASELLAALWEGVAHAHAQHSPESPARSLQESEVVREYSDRLVAKLEHQHLALLAAHEQMRLQATALATAANAIIITDHAGRILWVNPAFTALTGYTEKEAIGNTSRLLKSDRHDAAFYREFWNVILSGRTWHGEFTNRRKDGTLYYDQHTVTPVLGESGEITHFVGVTSDVTARKLAEEEIRKLNAELEQRVQERTAQLEAANKELESFSYSVSHDLRAPLRSMDGFSRTLLEDYSGKLDERGKDYLQRVRAASQRMGFLIDDLLELARLTRSAMQYTLVDVSSLARSVMAELEQSQPERQVEVVIAPGMQAHADPALLRVALVNLLGNAWKFTGKQPRARIEAGSAQHEGETVFFVRDDGAGFDMAYADKLFGAFQRLHGSQEFKGTGIGLATVQRVIHRHGGRVWTESQVGKGATFYFTLPG